MWVQFWKYLNWFLPTPHRPVNGAPHPREKSPDLRLVFLPRQTVDRAGHRLLRHPEILPLRGRFFAPVRIPAAKVSRIRTISEGSCFLHGRMLAAPVPLQVPAGRDGPQGLFFLEFLQWDGKREWLPFFPSSEVSCLKAGPIVYTYYQVCLL